MHLIIQDIKIVSAPCILGLKPTGVEYMADSLLASGLAESICSSHPVIHVPTLNALYNEQRDKFSCLNSYAIKYFSLILGRTITGIKENNYFPLVLGGDCSILIGIMSALKKDGNIGLIFLDAHADFYEPEKSISGEVADMNLAIVTGRGPEILKNINNLQPYAKDDNVIHIGQRDWKETKEYGSQDLRETSINCFSLAEIEEKGMDLVLGEVLQLVNNLEVEGFWIHYDTDVLSDEINPAVDYRLPGGLHFEHIENLIRSLFLTGRMAGISVTIFNPKLDISGNISKNIADSLGRSFQY